MTEDNVVSIYDVAIDNHPVVDDDIVRALESLLARAKDGQICGLAFATVTVNKAIGAGWQGSADHTLLIASTSRLWFRLMGADIGFVRDNSDDYYPPDAS